VPGRYDRYDLALRTTSPPEPASRVRPKTGCLSIPLVQGYDGTAPVELGIAFALVPWLNSAPFGFAIMPYAVGIDVRELPLTETVTLTFDAGVDLTRVSRSSFTPVRHPGANEALRRRAAEPGRTISPRLTVSGDGKPIILLGHHGSRFEIGTASIRAGVRPDTSKARRFRGGKLERGRIVFRHRRFRRVPHQAHPRRRTHPASSNLVVRFSNSDGLYFGGQRWPRGSCAVHLSLGPVEITGADVAVRQKTTPSPSI